MAVAYLSLSPPPAPRPPADSSLASFRTDGGVVATPPGWASPGATDEAPPETGEWQLGQGQDGPWELPGVREVV